MPESTKETEIAVLQTEMRQVREDVAEMKKMMNETSLDQRASIREAVAAFRDLFERNEKSYMEFKKQEIAARHRQDERLHDAETFIAGQQVRFDLKKDWWKFALGLAAVAIAATELITELT